MTRAFAAALAFAASFWACIWLALYKPAVVSRTEPLFLFRHGSDSILPIELTKDFTLDLKVKDTPTLRSAQSISFKVATYHTTPSLQGIVLKVPDLGCSFSLPAAVFGALTDNSVVTLNRDQDCSASSQAQTESWLPAFLTVKAENTEKLAVWGAVSTDPKVGNGQLCSTTACIMGDLHPPKIQETSTASPLTRGHLLNALWGKDIHSGFIWVGVCAAGLLLMGSVLAYFFIFLFPKCRTLAVSFSAFLLFSALGTFYAFLTPPFQAPDESDHYLNFAKLINQPSLDSDALELARVGHFERIKFHPDQIFTVMDIGHPFGASWSSHVAATDVLVRSPVTAKIWLSVRTLTQNWPVNQQIIFMRLLHTVIFASTLGLAACMLSQIPLTPLVTLICMTPFLIVPALPFFAMHFSDHAILATIYSFMGALLLRALIASKASKSSLFFLGLGLSLLLLTGRSSWPSLAFWLPVIAVMIAATTKDVKQLFVACASFLFGFALVWPLATNHLFAVYLRRFWSAQGHGVSALFAALSLTAVFFIAVWLCFVFFRWLSRQDTGAWSMRVGKIAEVSTGILLILMIVESLRSGSTLPDIEATTGPGISRLRYVLMVQKEFFYSLGMGTPDLFFVQSYWSGFGWLDSLLPTGITTLLKTTLPLGALATLFVISKKRLVGGMGVFLFLAMTIVIYLAAISVAVYVATENLHGRYLVGFYSVLIPSCFAGYVLLYSWLKENGKPRLGLALPLVLLSLCFLGHVVAILSNLDRYFG
jgi:hypothetical protein